MTEDEILACAREAVGFGYGTVVLQAGEDYGLKTEWIATSSAASRPRPRSAVTLSLGERPRG